MVVLIGFLKGLVQKAFKHIGLYISVRVTC